MSNTFHKELFLSDVLGQTEIPAGKLAYFRARLRNALHDVVLKAFDEQRRESGLKKSDIARRINRSPAQVTRWLSSPQNWTLDTISDLLTALGRDLDFTSSALGEEKTIETQRERRQSPPEMASIYRGARGQARRSSKGYLAMAAASKRPSQTSLTASAQ